MAGSAKGFAGSVWILLELQPGSYLWMVHLQHLGSKPDIDTQPGYPMLTFGQMATFLLRLPGKALFKSSV